MNRGTRFLASGQIEVTAARRAASDKDRIPGLRDQGLHRIDALVAPKINAQGKDVAGLFVDDRLGQTKTRDLGPHETAGLLLAFKHRDLIALGGQIARHGQRSRARADAGNLLAIAWQWYRHHGAHAVGALVVGRNAFEPANRDRLGLGKIFFLDPSSPAGRLAGPVASTAQNAREYIADPVDHIGVVVTTLGDQADVFGHRGMCRTGPLTIHDLVEIRGVGRSCWLQDAVSLLDSARSAEFR